MNGDPLAQRLMRLHPKIIDLGLSRMHRLLTRLGEPQRKLPPVVHVAGTNGKGSLVAYLRAMSEAAGYRAHVYTSPHLVKFNERIRLAGATIDDAAMLEALEECEAANGEEPITFFEITTAVAMLAFSRVPADIALIEVGLGGLHDATNVVDAPALTAITPVGIDHTHFLGDTLTLIAAEKAGILKRGAPAVIGRQRAESAAVIEARAAELGAPLWRMGREWTVEHEADGFRYRSPTSDLALPAPHLPGPHHFDNAATAIAAVERLRESGFRIDEAAIRTGLRSVEWPARLQRLTRGPLVESLPDFCELWLDGGHNADCGEALAAMAAQWRRAESGLSGGPLPLYLVFGMLTTKDAGGFLSPLAPWAAGARAVPIEGHEHHRPPDASARARSLGLDCRPMDNVPEAVRDILSTERLPARILICGSLYLAGAVLEKNG
jgi:dihydrofolate synthase/folylpolyglutamate synthase